MSVHSFTDGFRPPRGRGGDIANDRSATTLWEDTGYILERFRFEPGRSILLGAITHGKQSAYVGAPIDDRHGFTVAGSRAGKGTSFIIPNMLLYPGSVIANDPKGELANETAARRKAMGQAVAVLDPFGETQFKDDSFNPLDIIDPMSLEAIDEASLIADALIIQETGEGKYWTQAARNFLHGVILYVAMTCTGERRTLMEVRRLISQSIDTMMEPDGLLVSMIVAGGYAEETANAFVSKSEKEKASVLSTVQEQTTFLSSPGIARALGPSTIDIDSLKTSPAGLTIYLVLPARRMATHARFLRLMVNVALTRMEAVPNVAHDRKTANGWPVLFMLDEFAALGHMEVLERAAGLMAGYGVKLWTVMQDLTQLQRHYDKSWETFLGNSGVMQFFGNVDHTTCEYLSKLCGEVETALENRNEVSNVQQQLHGLKGWAYNMQTRPLIDPGEVRRYFARERELQCVLVPGHFPMALDRVQYFDPKHGRLFGR